MTENTPHSGMPDKTTGNNDLVLITRPEPPASALQDKLHEKGYKSIIEPLFTIVPLQPQIPPLTTYDALIFTSANAVRAFVPLSDKRDIPVYAVGPATAAACRKAGYKMVTTGPGDVDSLTTLIEKEKGAGHTHILYLSGTHISRPLVIQGIRIDRLVVYKAVARQTFSETLTTHLDRADISTVIFYSSRTAHIFKECLKRASRTECLRGIQALCISSSVVKSLEGLPWDDVRCADHPDTAHILKLLPDKTKD